MDAVLNADYGSLDACREIGPVTVRIGAEIDTYWYDWSDDKYTDSTHMSKSYQYIVHRESEAILAYGASLWRDGRGRIVATPEHRERSRECQYIKVNGTASNLREALEQAKYLERKEDGDILVLRLSATVYYDGREIGSASRCGVEVDDARDPYSAEVYADLISEAMLMARGFIGKVRGSVAA